MADGFFLYLRGPLVCRGVWAPHFDDCCHTGSPVSRIPSWLCHSVTWPWREGDGVVVCVCTCKNGVCGQGCVRVGAFHPKS